MKNRRQAFLYVMLAIPIGLMIIPTVIVLAVALVPTGVAFILERGKGYYGGITVGAMNLAGTAPYLADLWTEGHTVANAVGIITNVFAWLVFYGAALFGWAIYSTTPAAVSAFMTMTAGHRIAAMRAQQKELVQKWGPDVESVYEPEGGKAAEAAAAHAAQMAAEPVAPGARAR
jgi:hypothetical protein